jgi:hypothetical protein
MTPPERSSHPPPPGPQTHPPTSYILTTPLDPAAAGNLANTPVAGCSLRWRPTLPRHLTPLRSSSAGVCRVPAQDTTVRAWAMMRRPAAVSTSQRDSTEGRSSTPVTRLGREWALVPLAAAPCKERQWGCKGNTIRGGELLHCRKEERGDQIGGRVPAARPQTWSCGQSSAPRVALAAAACPELGQRNAPRAALWAAMGSCLPAGWAPGGCGVPGTPSAPAHPSSLRPPARKGGGGGVVQAFQVGRSRWQPAQTKWRCRHQVRCGLVSRSSMQQFTSRVRSGLV